MPDGKCTSAAPARRPPTKSPSPTVGEGRVDLETVPVALVYAGFTSRTVSGPVGVVIVAVVDRSLRENESYKLANGIMRMYVIEKDPKGGNLDNVELIEVVVDVRSIVVDEKT